MSKAFNTFTAAHTEGNLQLQQQGFQPLRLGQLFCFLYIKGSWPELFYEDRENRAAAKIEQWLTDNNYTEELPPKLV
jgi:hypothetical protein